MSSTKNNRIRRLTRRIEAKVLAGKTVEYVTPRTRRAYKHTATTKSKETGESIRHETVVWGIDKTNGRKERRDTEIKRLETALGRRFPEKTTGGFYYETPGKKERMRKFAHKKDARASKAQAKQQSKQSKGKKKGG